MKRCNVCKVEKSLDSFCGDKNQKDGLNRKCKSCASEYGKRYRKGGLTKRKIVGVENHYVYRLDDPITNEFYFGSRTCKNITPEEDTSYMGSMTAWKPEDKSRLVKTILKTFNTREEANIYEGELQKQYIKNPLNRNYYIQGVGFSTWGLSPKNKLTTEEFIKRATEVHGDKYNYSKTEYISWHDDLIIGCDIHGFIPQNAGTHLSGFGCRYCSNNVKKNTDEWISTAKEIHGDTYDYSEVNYLNNNTSVFIICKTHGGWNANPKYHLNGGGCPDCYFERNTGLNHSCAKPVINVFNKEIMSVTDAAKSINISPCDLSGKLSPRRTNATGFLYLEDYNKMNDSQINDFINFCKNYVNRRNQKVINIETNEIFNSITEAAKSISLDTRVLSDWLKHPSRNKSQIRKINGEPQKVEIKNPSTYQQPGKPIILIDGDNEIRFNRIADCIREYFGVYEKTDKKEYQKIRSGIGDVLSPKRRSKNFRGVTFRYDN